MVIMPVMRSSHANAVCRWDKNWIIHLDGLFQTTDRKGDYEVHVAKGLRRLVIFDTLKDVESDHRGAAPHSCPKHETPNPGTGDLSIFVSLYINIQYSIPVFCECDNIIIGPIMKAWNLSALHIKLSS